MSRKILLFVSTIKEFSCFIQIDPEKYEERLGTNPIVCE
jgi:hypothetical protein